MPDPPPAKRQPLRSSVLGPRSSIHTPRYAELHCKTNFSFLEGASHPDELVQRAADLGYAALAVTDRNSLAGVVRAHGVAKELGLKLLIGVGITPVDAPPAVLLATDRASYGRLCRLITRGRRAAPKGECRLTFADVAEHAEGLIACVAGWESLECDDSSPLSFSGRVDCSSEVLSENDLARERKRRQVAALQSRPGPLAIAASAPDPLHLYRDAFPHRCYALAELHAGPDDRRRLAALQQAARAARVPLVAANDVHYHEPERRFLHDVLTAIRHGCTVAELGERGFANAERYLKPPETMAALFAECPDAIARTLEIAGRCTFALDELRYEYPEELCPPGTPPLGYLTQLAWDGARRRYPQGIPDKVRGLIEHELTLIAELRYEAYFLTVWDLVRFARSRGILCQGRGSAANSAVCFCLEVTSVDPERIDVLFERFVSRERNEAPDIDVDFEHERREEVIQYVYEKYGRERAGMAATVITYRPRSAVRDVGKALALSLDRVGTLAGTLEHYNENEKLAARFREAGFDPTSRLGRQLIYLVRQILGFPRHLSQHVGGLVITQGLLCEYVPIENAAMPGRTVIQWDKDDLDAVGLLKVDCLALGMLTAVHRAFALLGLHYPQVVRELSGRGSGVQNSI
ncbi:MAG TPA: PHP domain-containing protein, partial [Planctomycetaceae bacterium]|nr:PHP domain-containing protein [Planctomycetaceae bacterium]